MSKELEANCFQWRNLYIHRFGICTYAPPMPKDPATTTLLYPTTGQLTKLRATYGASAGGEPSSPAVGATSAAASSAIEKTLLKSVANKAPTYYQQRRAEVERSKKLQREEIARQNPHGLASSVLRLHQAAWRLIMDDAVVVQSAKLSLEHSQLAHMLESHFRRQEHSADGATNFRRGRGLSLTSKRMSIFATPPNGAGSAGGGGIMKLLGNDGSNVDDGSMLRGDSFGDPFATAYQKAQLDSICCGADHELHAALRDEEATAATLYEFTPFFVSASPPDAVAATEAYWRGRKFQSIPEGRGAGAGELLGLPMFSQFQTWQEAYQRRTEWQLSPFHFFLAHDHSFNFAHIAALLTLLELYGRHKHQHIPDPAAIAASAKSAANTGIGARNGTTKQLKKKHSVVTPHPPAQAQATSLPSRSPAAATLNLPGIQVFPSGVFGAENSLSLGTPRAYQPVPQVSIPLEQQSSTTAFDILPSTSGGFHRPQREAPPEDSSARIKLLLVLDRMKDSVPRVLCNRHSACTIQQPSVYKQQAGSDGCVRNPCPVLAFEIAVEDLLLVFEQSSSRGAFKLVFKLFHYFLDKAMKPGHAARSLLTKKHIFPIDDPVTKIRKVVSEMEDSTRFAEKKRRMSKMRKISVMGINIESDGESDDSSDEDKKSPHAGSGSAGSSFDDNDDESSEDDEATEESKLSTFSELEFNALFHLAAYYVDLGFNLGAIKRYAKPGALPSASPGNTGAAGRRGVSEADQLTRAAMSVNFAPTATFAEAVLRFEAQQETDKTQKKIFRQASAHRERCNLNTQRRILDHETRIAEADREAEPYRKASSLAYPLILLGSYMRIHGAGWVRQVTRNVVEYLSSNVIQIYVTADMLDDPAQNFQLDGKAKVADSAANSVTRSASQNAEALEQLKKKKKLTFSGIASMLLHATSSPMMKALLSANVSPSESGVLAAGQSPGLLNIDASADVPSNGHSPSAPQLSPSALSLPRWSVSSVTDAEDEPDPHQEQHQNKKAPSGKDTTPHRREEEDRYTGYSDSEKAMFQTLERNEARICQQIEDAMRIFFADLEKSHFYERMPAGISRLITELCTTVHAQVLSGIVVLPPNTSSKDATSPGELSGNQLVELYVSTLLGDRRKPQQTSQAQGQKSVPKKRGITMIVEGEDDAASARKPNDPILSTPIPANATSSQSSPPAVSTPKKDQSPPPDVSTNITLVSDIRRFRMAKFVLFDTWILPMLTNALRYGLVTDSNLHALRNIDAFARYVKIVINGPFRAREVERKNMAAAAASSSTLIRDDSGLPNPPVKKTTTLNYGVSVAASSSATPLKNTIVMQPFISGVYNASTGGLVQLFVPPEDRRETVADGSESEEPSSVADSDATGGGASGHQGGRRRSSGGGRKKLRRTSSASSDDSMHERRGADAGRSMRKKSSKGGGLLGSSMRRKSTVVVDTKPNSTKELAMPRRRTEIVFRAQSDKWWPAIRDLSPAMQKLNSNCGTSGDRDQGPAAASGSAIPPIPTLVNYFCWRASTNEDASGVMPEYNVPPSAAAQAIENLHAIVVGKHPAVRPRESPHLASDIPRGGALGPEPDLSLLGKSGSVSFARQGGAGMPAGEGASSPDSSTDDGNGAPQGQEVEEDVVDEEGRSQYIRTLHSVLHYPFFASTFLENINVNNKKLFLYLVKPSQSHAAPLNSVMTIHQRLSTLGISTDGAQSGIKRGSTGFPWLTSTESRAAIKAPIPTTKLTDFSHLWTALASLIVQRDIPLLDVNAVLSVVAMASEQPPLHTLLPPPSLVASHVRLLQKQQFVTTALALPMGASAASANSAPAILNILPSTPASSSSLAPLQDASSTQFLSTIGSNNKRSHNNGSAHAESPGAETPTRKLGGAVGAADCPFHSFYSGLAIALCAKAAAVLEECSQTQNDSWVKKCARHLTRSTNEQLALQQLTGPALVDAPPVNLLNRPKKRRKLPTAGTVASPRSENAPRPPRSARKGGNAQDGNGEEKTENPEDQAPTNGRRAVADRWRRAVTDMVMVQVFASPADQRDS